MSNTRARARVWIVAGCLMVAIAAVGLGQRVAAATAETPAAAWPSGAVPLQTEGVDELPWHHGIVATTFWVGEVFDASAPDGSQVISTYDSAWLRHYGGCDGVVRKHRCHTERRRAADGFFPRHMQPKQNPFYLDLPFGDVNDHRGFRARCRVVPWAGESGYAGRCRDRAFSYLKNRWVAIVGPNDRTCYGQIEDAGPGRYHDIRYVFGHRDRRPANHRYGGAGLDVSPALTGCLGFHHLNGDTEKVAWRFVDSSGVPPGPWRITVTTTGVRE